MSLLHGNVAKAESFRGLVSKYAEGVPAGFVLTLIDHESGGDPSLRSPTGALGLMQITGGALSDYNRENSTNYEKSDLLNPEINIAVGARHLQKILSSYEKNHPASLSPDWRDPNFVGLVVYGWNAGHSELAGVGRVVRALEEAGVPKERISPDTVFQAAQKMTVASTLKEEARKNWAKKVAADFLGTPFKSSEALASTKAVKSKAPLYLALGAVGVTAAMAVYHYKKQKQRESELGKRVADAESLLEKIRAAQAAPATGGT